MGTKWTIEQRDSCKRCGKDLPNARYRVYCSKECRERSNYLKQKKSGYNTRWQKEKRDYLASLEDPKKVQCLICGKWYVQVCSHVQQVHGMTKREYKKEFGLDVKRGVVPDWYRKLKGDQAMNNDTYKNLKAGEKYRFKKGDPKVGVYTRSQQTLERLRSGLRG